MLQNIRDKSQGLIAKAIIGLIVILMAFTGFEAIFNSVNNDQTAAEVNGEEITIPEVNQAVEMQRRQLAQQLGPNFDSSMLDDGLLRESAVNGLIDRMLLLQGAQASGFAFSEQALDQLIVQTPEFQVNGVFDPARFDQTIAQMGYGRLQFRDMLKKEMLVAQLRAGVSGTSFVTEEDIRAFAALERQTRDFAVRTVKATKEGVDVSDDEVNAFYDKNASRFMSPEQVVIEYVELKKQAFVDEADVSEDDLQALYQREIANLAERRRAAHILIEVNDQESDAQAKARIEELRKRIDAGEDFAALAKEASQDQGSASEGGDLGFAGPGVYDPAFEKALYALDQNGVSEPVKTAYGWHLIKLLGVQSADVPTFESLKAKLTEELKAQQADSRFLEASKTLESSAFESSDLAQPAEEMGLKVQTSAPFGREGGEGLTANRQIAQAAFSQEVLEERANSQLIELDPETSIVLRVKEHLVPKQLPLAEVADQIRLQLSQQKASEKAKAEGEKYIADARNGGSSTGNASDWQVIEAANRNQEGVDPAVLQQAFRMAKPEDGQNEYAGIALNDGDFAIIRLDGVNSQATELSEEDLANYRRFLASRVGQQDFLAFRQQLREQADIERR
ncbi:SurA N-terminal domain-containing protein [Pseudomonas matsuisoli]|uniref:Periplasmic chaperone PpiD n=1 Tax=Pseudomonas matsuisoli TaxID=1515666 RepID=A0A917UV02_9PSED|nr:SurA N-terminal domain-containing protein [Pseudomonas matsuisoli]GGJ88305.1 peptidylprolyl isomerase [Pseudomonas matsuisoli]